MLTDDDKALIVQEARTGGSPTFTSPEALDLRRQADEALAHAAAAVVTPPDVVAPEPRKKSKAAE